MGQNGPTVALAVQATSPQISGNAPNTQACWQTSFAHTVPDSHAALSVHALPIGVVPPTKHTYSPAEVVVRVIVQTRPSSQSRSLAPHGSMQRSWPAAPAQTRLSRQSLSSSQRDAMPPAHPTSESVVNATSARANDDVMREV